jgi:hypothetical protein
MRAMTILKPAYSGRKSNRQAAPPISTLNAEEKMAAKRRSEIGFAL